MTGLICQPFNTSGTLLALKSQFGVFWPFKIDCARLGGRIMLLVLSKRRAFVFFQVYLKKIGYVPFRDFSTIFKISKLEMARRKISYLTPLAGKFLHQLAKIVSLLSQIYIPLWIYFSKPNSFKLSRPHY